MNVNVCGRHHVEPEFSLWKQSIGNIDGAAEQDVASAAGDLSHQACDFEPPVICSSDLLSTPHSADNHVADDRLLTTRNFERTSNEGIETSELSVVTNDDLSTKGSSCQTTDVKLSSSVSETQQLVLNQYSGVVDLPVDDVRPSQNIATSDTQLVESRDDQNLAHKVSASSNCGTVLSQIQTAALDQPVVSSSSSFSADSEAVNTTSMDTTTARANSGTHLPVADNFAHPVGELSSAENIQSSPSEPSVVCAVYFIDTFACL